MGRKKASQEAIVEALLSFYLLITRVGASVKNFFSKKKIAVL
jgi:hypothetical protein